MAEMAYLKIFRDFREVAESISSAALGHILLAALRYADDEDPGKLTTLENSIFIFLRQQIDRDRRDYQEKLEKMSEMGRKGGRPRKPALTKACDDDEKKAAAFQKPEKKAAAFSNAENKTSAFQKNQDKEKDEGKDKEKEKEKDNDNDNNNDYRNPPPSAEGAADVDDDVVPASRDGSFPEDSFQRQLTQGEEGASEVDDVVVPAARDSSFPENSFYRQLTQAAKEVGLQVTPAGLARGLALARTFGEEQVLQAIGKAVDRPIWAYVEGILKNGENQAKPWGAVQRPYPGGQRTDYSFLEDACISL